MRPLDISLSGSERTLFIAVLIVGLAVLTYEVYFYLRLLLSLKPQNRTDNLGTRFNRLLKFVFGQRRLLDQIVMGTAHFLIFWGFVIVSFGTLTFFGKAFSRSFELPLLGTLFRTPFLFLLDLFSILVLIGILIAVLRRFFPSSKR